MSELDAAFATPGNKDLPRQDVLPLPYRATFFLFLSFLKKLLEGAYIYIYAH